MGYTTDFRGQVTFDKPLTVVQKKVLEEFSEERHGGNTEVYAGFPGFWCDWVPTEDGTGLEHNGNEKFYNYVEWLEYIIEHFVKPWNLKLNGEIEWRGEEWEDTGTIYVEDNIVRSENN